MIRTATVPTLLFATLAVSGSAQSPQKYAPGQQIRVCGEVTQKRTNPATCETLLTVVSGGEDIPVLIPASVRDDVSPPPERLRGASVCVTGQIVAAGRPGGMRVQIASAKDIEVVKPAQDASFGSTAVTPCGGTVVLPRIVSERKPSYTANAMREKVEGTVDMEAVVDADGDISEARIVRSLHPELDEQALAALKLWKFRPGSINGKPVAMLVDVEMSFKIRRDK